MGLLHIRGMILKELNLPGLNWVDILTERVREIEE
nr:MAG TPA: hypothetical protein [Crassvirales sp.]